MQWLVNTSLLKVICRCLWLCIPSNLQANIKQVRPAGDKKYTKYYIEAITFNPAIRTNIYEMTWSPSSVLTLDIQRNSNWILKTEFKLSQKQLRNKIKCEAKRHKVMPTMQQTRRSWKNRAWLAQRVWTEDKLCKEHS